MQFIQTVIKETTPEKATLYLPQAPGESGIFKPFTFKSKVITVKPPMGFNSHMIWKGPAL